MDGLQLIQLLSHVQLFATQWTAAYQASLSMTNFQSLLKLVSMELAMPSNHLTLCYPLLFLPSILPSIRVFPNKSVLHISWLHISTTASWAILSTGPTSLGRGITHRAVVEGCGRWFRLPSFMMGCLEASGGNDNRGGVFLWSHGFLRRVWRASCSQGRCWGACSS